MNIFKTKPKGNPSKPSSGDFGGSNFAAKAMQLSKKANDVKAAQVNKQPKASEITSSKSRGGCWC